MKSITISKLTRWVGELIETTFFSPVIFRHAREGRVSWNPLRQERHSLLVVVFFLWKCTNINDRNNEIYTE